MRQRSVDSIETLVSLKRSLSDSLPHCFSQLRNDGLFEPGVLAHPDDAPPTGMRQREELRTVGGKSFDGLSHGAPPLRSQIMPLRVLTDQDRELQMGKMLEQSFVPMRSALRARRQIALVFSRSRVTKT